MNTMILMPLLAALHGGATPLLWVIGIILVVAGAVMAIRGSLLTGIVIVVIGVFLGGLNIL